MNTNHNNGTPCSATATQPEPAASERWEMSSPIVNQMIARDDRRSDPRFQPIGIDLKLRKQTHYAALQVFAGEEVARRVFTAVNHHEALVAALEAARTEIRQLRWQVFGNHIPGTTQVQIDALLATIRQPAAVKQGSGSDSGEYK